MLHRLRWAMLRRWRKMRHLGGDFTVAEDSARSSALTQSWGKAWLDCEPLGHALVCAHPDRWVRFHSLPGGKRSADTEDEHRVVLDRHLAVLSELGAQSTPIIIIAEEFGPEDLFGGWSRNLLTRAWPWRIHTEFDDDRFPPIHRYFWVQEGTSHDQLSRLLTLAADDRADFLIAAPDLAWIYAPYDGGADVMLRERVTLDALRRAHPDWLSDRPDGL